MRGDRPYSLEPLRQHVGASVDYAFSSAYALFPGTARLRRSHDEIWRDMRADALDLECRGVRKRFGAFVAVDRVSFGIPSGSFFSILGPSGCGKRWGGSPGEGPVSRGAG